LRVGDRRSGVSPLLNWCKSLNNAKPSGETPLLLARGRIFEFTMQIETTLDADLQGTLDVPLSAGLASEYDDFQAAAHDLWSGRKSGHTGQFWYAPHRGRDGDRPMNGAMLWEALTCEPDYYLAREDVKALRRVLPEIAASVPAGLDAIDIGPGSLPSLTEKSLAIVRSCSIARYIAFETAPTFARTASEVMGKHIQSIAVLQQDAFKRPSRYASENALVYFGGSTCGNLPGPVPHAPPVKNLARSFLVLTRHAVQGYFLVSYDANRDEQALLCAYNNRLDGDFKRNILFRMADELNMEGFDPGGFRAESLYYPKPACVAHYVIATRRQRFRLDGLEYRCEPGQTFHLANSFKFSRKTILKSAEIAALKPLWHCSASGPIRHALFSF
jgi:L-histidine Nalpha-methyltransferase